ncbi:MAG: hypothetical protein R3F49_13970 [Planctomycetota bacterium]
MSIPLLGALASSLLSLAAAPAAQQEASPSEAPGAAHAWTATTAGDTRADGVEAELAALVQRDLDLPAAQARAAALGRELLVVVTGDHAHGEAALSLQERLVHGIVLADPRVRSRIAERFVVATVETSDEALRSVIARRMRDSLEFDVPSAEKPLRGLTPPALALVDADGHVSHALERLAPADPGSVAAWLDQAGLRVDVNQDDVVGAAYLDAARAPRAEQPALLAALVAEHPGSPWALKARARAAYVADFSDFELFRLPLRPRPEHEVIAEATARLLEAQQPDGSFPGSYAVPACQVTAFAALALHSVGAHDAAQRAVEWLDTCGVHAERAGDALLAATWADIQLTRYAVGWSRAEEVEAALATLVAAADPNGGWTSAGSLGARWIDAAGAAPRVSSVHTGFALDVLLRARAAEGEVGEFALDDALLARAADALVALRGAKGHYSDLIEPPPGDTGRGMCGLTFAADAALTRLERIKRRGATAAIDVYFEELADLRASEALGGVGARHPALTGETRALGWLGYARLTTAAPGRALLRRDGRLRRVVSASVGADSTWLDTCEQGWVVSTALAVITLEVTR